MRRRRRICGGRRQARGVARGAAGVCAAGAAWRSIWRGIGLADLFLDTLPYNAHTTASDALWAGLPVLTCVGQTFAGRVAGSLLHAVGLPELVTRSLAEYEALALAAGARAGAAGGAARASWQRNRDDAPLFDIERFRRHLEAAYETMWERPSAANRRRASRFRNRIGARPAAKPCRRTRRVHPNNARPAAEPCRRTRRVHPNNAPRRRSLAGGRDGFR